MSEARRALGLGAGLILFRWLLLAALPYESLVAYGDLRHFFQLAQLAHGPGGLPFVGHWIEFPPLFPFLSVGLYTLVNGSEHAYVYALAAFLACVDGANLYLFVRLVDRLGLGQEGPRPWIYFVFLALPALGWWTFEPLGVVWLMLSLALILSSRPGMAGLAAGMGMITKWIPGLGLLAAWPTMTRRQALGALAVALAVVALAWAPLLVAGGPKAWDSLQSQSAKPAWETVWALLDGSLGTGTFGPAALRLERLAEALPEPARAVVPRWIPWLLAAGMGAVMALKKPPPAGQGGIPFVLAAFGLVFLASPGWSPQWMAYLVPLTLLAFPVPKGWLYALVLSAVTILEWPVLLSRGRFDLLWITVTLRTLVLILLVVDAWRVSLRLQPFMGKGSS